MLQTVFKAGNSSVVAIPKQIAYELGIKVGQRVIVDKSPDGEVIIRKATKKSKKKARSVVGMEFKKWLKEVVKEDAKILDELSVR